MSEPLGEIWTIGHSNRSIEDFLELLASQPDSPNRGWRVDAFNAYADYMATETFREALLSLEELARSHRTAILCSEALPWQRHRRRIADALIVRGWHVRDIMSATQTNKGETSVRPFVFGRS